MVSESGERPDAIRWFVTLWALAIAASPAAGAIYLFKGNGLGGFGVGLPFNCGIDPRDLIVVDIDGDDALDAIVANGGAGTVSVMIGDGAGSFAEPQPFPVGNTPVALALGDFNEDGVYDIVTANMGDSTATVLPSNP